MDQYQTFLAMEKGLSEKTIAAYSADLMRFGLFLEKKNTTTVSDIDTGLVLTYLIHLRQRGLSARSRARHLVSLRGFFKYLTNEKTSKRIRCNTSTCPKPDCICRTY
jgi:integrase/recombinase XerD